MSLARIRRPTLIVLSLVLASGLLFSEPALTSVYADTSVGGPIISNTTWTKAQSPYLVVANIEVWEGVTLTIEPGVVVKMQPGKLIQVSGTLIARGTAAQYITFTSAKNSPAPGDWGSITFSSSALPTVMDSEGNYVSGSILQYCVVEYAGSAGSHAISANSHLVSLCTARNNKSGGIRAIGTDAAPARITNNTVTNNTAAKGGGIYAEYSTVSGNSVINNTVSVSSWYAYGGGIYAEDSTVTGNYVSGNSARGGEFIGGGGIYAKYSTISDNFVSHNTVSNGRFENGGGGIDGWDCTISGNTVRDNSTTGSGGGISADGGTTSGNIVTGNSAVHGGGILGVHGTIIDNVVTRNSAQEGGGIWVESATVAANTITSNSTTVRVGYVAEQGAGIFASWSTYPCSILQNTIVGNSASSPAVIVGGLATEGQPEVHHNTLYGNSNYDVVVLYDDDVDGTNNYWGTVATVDILSHVYDWYDSTSRGRLLYIPYLQDPDPNAPVPPPMNLRGTFSGSSATLTWDAIPSTTTGYRYKIYYDNDQSDPPYQGTGLVQGNSPIDVGNLTSYMLTGLAGGKYYFVVTGYDNQGHESWYSNLVVRLNKVYLPLIRR